MYMKRNSMFAIAILSVSLLSLGVTDSFGDSVSPLSMIIPSDIYDAPPLTMIPMLSLGIDVIIPQASYTTGETVELSGQIKNYNASKTPKTAITVQIFSPADRLIHVGQISPSKASPSASLTSDGSYTYTFPLGERLWKDSGNYTVKVFFGGTDVRAEEILTFEAKEKIVEPTKPDPVPIECPDGTTLVNGDCVPDAPAPIECEQGTTLVNGDCVPDAPPPPPPPPPPCPPDTERVDGECVPKVPPIPEPQPTCGPGTQLVDGICVPSEPEPEPTGGGCLIATAAHGTELAPQVQFLREIRDNTVMSTGSGTAFMAGFNQIYYSFSPTIADMERSNPAFQQTVRAFITPMITSLSIMTLAEDGSEMDVLGLGISVIALNIGMYIVAPTLVGITIHRCIRSRRS